MNDIIYLDNNSTTQIDPRVLEAMLPYLTEKYANASSNHFFGIEIKQSIVKARNQVAELIGAEPNEVIFTSGATEAINMALKGIIENYQQNGRHIVTVVTEHPAVLDTCRYLETVGFNVSHLPVKSDGLINLDQLKKSFTNDTILVSVMLVNNEIGVIQPIKEISEIAHSKGTLFMTDATQAVGKMPINVEEFGIDLMSFSGHKFYGPKGIGVLYVRKKGANKVKVSPLIHGGGHEMGLRSGTLNVAGIVGLGKAAEISMKEMKLDAERIKNARNTLERELLKIDNTKLNGNKEKRLYNVSNICFRGIDSEIIVNSLKNIVVSNGSACSSMSVEPSYVLTSMGLNKADAFSSIRFSLSKFNTIEEIEKVIKEIRNLIRKTNELSNMNS